MNATDLDRLAELAEAATPGPWYARLNDLIGGYAVMNEDKPPSLVDWKNGVRELGVFLAESDAAFIAAANPATVAALIEHIRELEGEPIDLGPCSSCNDDPNVDCPVGCGRA